VDSSAALSGLRIAAPGALRFHARPGLPWVLSAHVSVEVRDLGLADGRGGGQAPPKSSTRAWTQREPVSGLGTEGSTDQQLTGAMACRMGQAGRIEISVAPGIDPAHHFGVPPHEPAGGGQRE